MYFNTIEEYNEELNSINLMLKDMERRINSNPDDVLTKGNYRALKDIYNVILKDRDDFLKMMGENINLQICGGSCKKP